MADEPSPYQGLGFYTENDARWFFGRDAERTRIISNLRTSRLTTLYAESGVGKSSVLRAGVVARLTELATQSIEQRGVARFVPIIFSDWQDEPIEPLIAEIKHQSARFRVPVKAGSLAAHGAGVADDESVGQTWENGDSAAGLPESKVAKAIAEAADSTDSTLLIILDQFEEHFRYRLSQDDPERVAEDLAACVNAPRLPVRFLIAVREDAYGGLGDLFRGRIGNVYKNYIHLEYLTRESARQAIEGPIERFNEDHPDEPPMRLGEGLVEAVLKEVRRGNLALGPGPDDSAPTESLPPSSSDEIEAPFLQLVMDRLWKRERHDGSLVLSKATLDDKLGGAERIVSDHLTDALSGLDEHELEIAKRMFRELVTPSGAKIAHTVSDLAGIIKSPEQEIPTVPEQHVLTVSEQDVQTVFDKLEKERVVRAVDPAPGAAASRYEIFHDKLAAAILDWLGQLRTEQLRQQKERAERQKVQAERQKAQAEEQKAEAERLKAQAEQAEREQRRLARRFRLMALGFGVLALGMCALALIAWQATKTANHEKGLAIQQSTRAAYFGLTTRAESQLASRPDIALLLFLAAYEVNPRPLAERSLVATYDDVKMSGTTGILHGHSDAIEAVAFPPHAPLLASASGDGTIRLWHVDRTSHYPIAHPFKVGGPVLSVAFSPDARRMASGSFNELIVWDLATRRRQTEHPFGAITSVAFSRTGQWVAAASLSGAVFLWNLDTGKAHFLTRRSGKPVRSIAFSPTTDDLLASGETGGNVVLWNAATGRVTHVLNERKNDVYAVAFSPKGDLLAAAGSGKTISVWNVGQNDKFQPPLVTRDGFIYSLAFDPKSDDALAAGGMGDVQLWNPATQHPITARLIGQQGAVYGVAFSPDGGTLVSAGADRTIHLWNYPIMRPYGAALAETHRGPVLSVAVAPNGMIASTSFFDGRIPVFGGPLTHPMTLSARRRLNAVAFAEDGRVLAAAGNSGWVQLWEPLTGTAISRQWRPSGQRIPILSLASDPKGTTLITGDAQGNVRVWNVATGAPVGSTLTRDLGAAYSVAYSRATGEIAAGGSNRTIQIWKPENGRWVPWRAFGQGDAIFALAFSPNGSELASAGADGSIRIWNLTFPPSTPPEDLVGPAAFVRGLAFSPDGKTLASASGDATVRLWDVGSGTLLGSPLVGDTNTVESVAFSSNGKYLASGSDDRTVRLWQAPALPTSFLALRTDVCNFLGAGLNVPEWKQYAPDVNFRNVCPRLTPG